MTVVAMIRAFKIITRHDVRHGLKPRPWYNNSECQGVEVHTRLNNDQSTYLDNQTRLQSWLGYAIGSQHYMNMSCNPKSTKNIICKMFKPM